MSAFGMPGPGGSMGMCALCGENFLKEVITGSRVRSITVDGVDSELFAHDKCIAAFAKENLPVTDLPEKSPLRQAYERNQKGKS